MGAAQDVVSGEGVMLEGRNRTEITAGAEVSKGVVVTTSTPPPSRHKETGRRWSELLGRR